MEYKKYIGAIGEVAFAKQLNSLLEQRTDRIRIAYCSKNYDAYDLKTILGKATVFLISLEPEYNKDGTLSMDNLYTLFEDIHDIIDDRDFIYFIIRSEIVPGTYSLLTKLYPSYNFSFVKEVYGEEKNVLIASDDSNLVQYTISLYNIISDCNYKIFTPEEFELIPAFLQLNKKIFEEQQKILKCFGANIYSMLGAINEKMIDGFSELIKMKFNSKIDNLRELQKEAELHNLDSSLLKSLTV